MKKAAWTFVAALALLLVLPGMAVAGEAESKTFEGEYQWNRQDEPGAIKAVFTATGENQWKVDFYFTFREEDHVYSGTAEGSLENGSLTGEVVSDGEEPHPFTFEGTVKNGVFEGTHASVGGEEKQDTGTISLRS
ncbi:MAG: hypothetical protein MI919_32815 [Holophagales bacterium]|nr:hypothetical protein [Holophagales bacterium]